ncbi:hypothetical protein GPEL0_01f4482 [Geoanaerobacter pelophilus]|uniref:Rubrerythrin n=1 Tax=Geoanaerobacter pelophilus TaxID=60036 RepID=A0ABQ0MMP3_9BACT|nr:DUF6448 family protein [Geoanaerobacter pelophilus]GAW68234.1 hypothetical protein GPEL0_01f4482 [Geoanaerobacter pelophilus]
MKTKHMLRTTLAGIAAVMALTFGMAQNAAAHCDTLDGPVVQDAHKALEAKDITPVLKWVKAKDEKAVKAAFSKALAAKGANAETAHHQFFATLVKIHRAGEGAPFTGLKPAGAVEPAVAEADKALASGSADALVKLVTDDVTAGIKHRYERAAAAYKHKDESVAQGREFVEAYVEYTHYVEKLHMDATGKAAHGEHKEPGKQHGGHAGHGADKH